MMRALLVKKMKIISSNLVAMLRYNLPLHVFQSVNLEGVLGMSEKKPNYYAQKAFNSVIFFARNASFSFSMGLHCFLAFNSCILKLTNLNWRLVESVKTAPQHWKDNNLYIPRSCNVFCSPGYHFI